MSDLLIDSDSPMDKVVYLYEGSVRTDYQTAQFNLTHGVGAILFVDGIWSADNWATTYSFGASKRSGDVMAITSNLNSDSSRIEGYILVDRDVAIRYKLWGVVSEMDTLDLNVDETASESANRFIINSDYNYPRLIREGMATPNTTITHGLGSIPRVDVWRYSGNMWAKMYNDGFGTTYGGFGEFVKLSDRNIVFTDNLGCADRYYYRIYEQ